jgi:DNA invertase Pin-like site-specific DNA recombinase
MEPTTMESPQKKQSATTGRLWAYIRATTNKQIPSPEDQRGIVCERAQKMGRVIDGFYVDKAIAGDKPIMEREAGSRLFVDMRRGDTVLVARLDRFSRSFIEFAKFAFRTFGGNVALAR